MRILTILPQNRDLIHGRLHEHGVRECADLDEMLLDARLDGVDLMIVGLERPRGSQPPVAALRVLRRARTEPIVVLAGLACDHWLRAELLNAGADDVVPLECDPREVAARAEAVMRRSIGAPDGVLPAGGDFAINLRLNSATWRGQRIPLAQAPYRMLRLLAERRGLVVARETMIQAIETRSSVDEFKVVDVQMSRLRRRMFEISGGLDFIETVHAQGWRLSQTPIAPPRVPYSRGKHHYRSATTQECVT